jgi:sarcosine oxidase
MADEARLACECLVVGGGICGLSALDALRQDGVDAVLVEQGQPGGAQSAGVVRIFRLAHDDAEHVALAWQALELWRAWEQRFSTELVVPTALVMVGDGAALRASHLADHGGTVRPAATVDGIEDIGLGTLGDVLVDAHGGAIRANVAIETLAREHAPRIVTGEQALSVGRRGRGFRAQTQTRLVDAERVVLAAGVQTPLLASQLGIPLDAAGSEVHLRATFELGEQRSLPCIIDRSGTLGVHVYGSPVPGTARFVIGRSGADPAAAAAAAESDDAVADLRRYAETAFAPLSVELVGLRSCEATVVEGVKDGFVLRHTDRASLVCGPNLFKFAPVIGRLLADGAASRVML